MAELATGTRSSAKSIPNLTARRQLGSVLPAVPGLLIVAVLLLIPVAVMVARSFVGSAGGLSLENYQRLAEPLYRTTFIRTFEVALIVTLIAAILAYPVSYLLAHAEARMARILLVFVILPYWTSVLVRTYAWIALLQRRGVINNFLMNMGVISEPLPLMNNLFGTVIGMVHIMMPLVVLPLYASMRSIDPTLVKAAAVCGASPWQAFRDVYFPKTLPGLFAGMTFVFVLALGYYVIPALLGGGRVLLWSMQIETTMSTSPTIGPASALGVLLLLATLFVLAVIGRWLKLNK